MPYTQSPAVSAILEKRRSFSEAAALGRQARTGVFDSEPEDAQVARLCELKDVAQGLRDRLRGCNRTVPESPTKNAGLRVWGAYVAILASLCSVENSKGPTYKREAAALRDDLEAKQQNISVGDLINRRHQSTR